MQLFAYLRPWIWIYTLSNFAETGILMRRLFLAFLLFCPFFVHGQNNGSEWINFNQTYFKIPVGKDGIYRITYSDLQAAGFPTGADPRQFQLFRRGVEQAIYVAGEDDSQFDNGDFIEFYGQRNDGTLDAELYTPNSAQPHPYYNLYSDTSWYFLSPGFAVGRRMDLVAEPDPGYIPDAYHINEQILTFADNYSQGEGYNEEIYNSYFVQGEGWTGAQINQTQYIDYTVSNVSLAATSSGVPRVEILLAGRGVMNHQAEIYVGQSVRLAGTALFSGFNTYIYQQDLQWSDISSDGKLLVRVKDVGTGGVSDRLSVTYIKLRYPQQFNAGGLAEKKFILAPNGVGKSYVEISNAPSGTRVFDVTDPNGVLRINTSSTPVLNGVVTGTTIERTLYATSAPLPVVAIKPVTFQQITATDYNYIIISHGLLRKAALGYSDPVQAYADYRASVEGGSYSPLVVNMDQLYDQFSYGERSPLATFHFMRFLSTTRPPSYLFLIGKSMDLQYGYWRRPQNYPDYNDLIPTGGTPGSDVVFSVGLGGDAHTPAVPTGRITAMQPVQVAAYLNKVKTMEALPFDALWRKDIMHLSGGIEEGEPEEFKGYMQEFQARAEDYYLGGRISAIAKRSRDVQVINIAEQVNKGLNLITFFGHASPSTLDFDIGYVTNPVMGYNNPNKYPFLLMNGCEAGAFFLYGTLFGEDWVFADKKGALGFLAHSSYGLVSTLRSYTNYFYNIGYQDSLYIRKSIGEIQQETIRRYMATASTSVIDISQTQQMVLLADPAAKLFGATKPDLEINNDNVFVESLDGQPVTALTDAFALRLIVRNFGQARPDTMRIEVTRTLNDNSTVTYDSLFSSVKYSDTLTFYIQKGRENGAGNNTFTITLDPDNVVSELTKNNNVAEFRMFMPLNGTKNLFPYNYAIVHDNTISLSFQATNLLSDERDFLVEVDTVNTFNSPYRQAYTVSGKVLARQVIQMLEADTLAYYWRTKLAQPAAEESTDWTLSSFTYIHNGPEGWAQVHFPQYLDDTMEGLVADADSRRFSFRSTVTPVSVTTFGPFYPAQVSDASIRIDNQEYNLTDQGFYCRSNTLNLIAFDRRSTVPYIGVPFKWYNRAGRSCGREPWVINSFAWNEMVTGNNDDLIAYVDNVAAGDSVLLFSLGDAVFSNWPAAAKTKLGELGISTTQIDALQPGEPVIIFGRKGLAPGDARMYRTSEAPASSQLLTVNRTVTGGYSSGTLNSGLIGPATEWKSLSSHTTEIEATDQVVFDITGVSLEGKEQVLRSEVQGNQDLSDIDAGPYPYLKITFRSTDDTELTASQLRHWIVAYTAAPEGMLLFDGPAEQQLFTEGDTWTGNYRFVNISDKVFPDSLAVRYEFFNTGKRVSQNRTINIGAPQPGDTTRFSVRFESEDWDGLNDVNVFVNPRVLPEQYYDNNVLNLASYLNVQFDDSDPVLDVTIDGRYILRGDFVSPTPTILVKLWDENQHLLKTDTTGVRIFLTYPECADGACNPRVVDLGGKYVTWYPATDTSVFRVVFRPEMLPEGEYTLRVEAQDVRGNSSGANPYEISFVVEYETSITLDGPYPNPFSTETNFDLSLSGTSLPNVFVFQIVDVTGRFIREFPMQDFHIGRNRITWDGTDAAGRPVHEGVYVYKLQVGANGTQSTRYGKIVLVR